MIDRSLCSIDEIMKFLAKGMKEKTVAEAAGFDDTEFVYEEGDWKYVSAYFWHNDGIVGSEAVYYKRFKVYEIPSSSGKIETLEVYANLWRSRD